MGGHGIVGLFDFLAVLASTLLRRPHHNQTRGVDPIHMKGPMSMSI